MTALTQNIMLGELLCLLISKYKTMKYYYSLSYKEYIGIIITTKVFKC